MFEIRVGRNFKAIHRNMDFILGYLGTHNLNLIYCTNMIYPKLSFNPPCSSYKLQKVKFRLKLLAEP